MSMRVRAELHLKGYPKSPWYEEFEVQTRDTAALEVKLEIYRFNRLCGTAPKRVLLALRVSKNQDMRRHIWKRIRKADDDGVEVWKCLNCRVERPIVIGPPSKDFCYY